MQVISLYIRKISSLQISVYQEKFLKYQLSSAKILGVMLYIDPKGLSDQNYKLNKQKQSDVYSVGVYYGRFERYEPFKSKS